ncbi:MAG: TraR/DksA family transcriptional regulator [Acidimicrobiales bacterium]
MSDQDSAAVLRGIEQRLDAIETALNRLDDGSYSTCERCGGPISDTDLQADPARRLCGRESA